MRYSMLFVVGLIFIPAATAGSTKYNDAPLRAVQFVDRNEGWAVGDDGTIWHTIDAGETWERQSTGVRGSLRGLHFVNPYTGWAIGREELPGGESAGIILFTSDGGLKWSQLAPNTLPGLHAVRFFDDQNGIVAGDSNDRYSSGVFTTADGGKTWTIVPGSRVPGWLAADFSDPKTGVLAGAWSSVAMLRESVFGRSETDTLGGRSLLGVKLYRNAAFAVGQGGLILKSGDSAGAKWVDASPKSLGAETLTNCDFHAVHVLGEHVWVVGRPGSFVLHSSDYARTWKVHFTGQSMPLNGVHFLDPRTGWAVGDLGTILATTDGGASWKIQRRGGERLAAMLVHAGVESLPLDLIAQLGGDAGYLCGAMRLLTADPNAGSLSRAADRQKWIQAVRLAGGTSADCFWHFPTATHQNSLNAKDLLGAFDRLHGGEAGEMMIRQVVLAIRMWQPELMIGDEATDGGTTLCFEAIREGFNRAGDPKAYPEQIERLGLKPWNVKKLYTTSDASKYRAHAVRVITTEPLAQSGSSAREIGLIAADALGQAITLPSERGLTRRECRLPASAPTADLMDGIVLEFAGTARRERESLTATEVEALEKSKQFSRTIRNIEALSRPDWKAIGGPEQVLAQLGSLLKSLPADLAGRTAFSVANDFARSGQWELAREVFELMTNRNPTHSLAPQAYRWLARYGSSAEARRRWEMNQFITTSTSGVKAVNYSDQKRGGLDDLQTRAWHRGALAVESRMAALGTLHLHDPAFQFCLQSARRTLGEGDIARKWLTRFAAETTGDVVSGRDPWREVAATELWLLNRSGNSARPIGTSKFVSEKPYLDGKLDDACWTEAKPLVLRTSAGALNAEYAAKALIAFDAEFLYIAISCDHPAGKQVAKVEKRLRDENLSGHDRISIMLDLDRDFQTYYRFEVDQRGCLSEDCWGDRTWNPKWYVAHQSNETNWTAEIAIPRTELTGEAFTPTRVWACNVVRVVPGLGLQSWSLPADVNPRPEGMGMLIFANEKK